MHSSSRIRGLWSYTCEERYNISYSYTNTRTALYIIGLLILTVVLEVAVHKDLEGFEGHFSSSKSATKTDEETANLDDDNNETVSMIDQQPNPYQQLLLSAQQQDTAKPKDTAQRTSNFCLPSPSPSIRANRLVAAALLYTPLLTLFVLLVDHVKLYHHVDVASDCFADLNPSTVQYVAFTFLAILPFICGTAAFLRALVDALLVRWHTGLHYRIGFECGGEGCTWWVCMPLTGVFMSVGVVLYVIWMVLKMAVEVLMGREKEKEREEEIEMRNKEQRLVGGMEDDVESDGLPAYEEVDGLLGAEEVRGKNDGGA